MMHGNTKLKFSEDKRECNIATTIVTKEYRRIQRKSYPSASVPTKNAITDWAGIEIQASVVTGRRQRT